MTHGLRCPIFWWLVILFSLWIGLGISTTAQAQTTEICNNGIDDDGDRLVDCQDPDCPEGARFINCVEPNTCYMPPTWAVPASPTAQSDPNDLVYGAQDLVLSTNADVTTVTIRTADGSFTKTVVVTATGSTIVSLPLSVVMSNTPNIIQRNKGLIITSGEPVQVTYRQTPGLNQDIVPLKCRAALGYSFYAGSQTRLTTTNIPSERHFVSVMATQPNTVVTFRSPVALAGASTFPFSVTLQAGDSYMLASRLINNGANSANESVSGVLVTSTEPIVVNSGSQHTAQPYSGNRDAGIDQLVPIRITGTNYVAMHGENTTANSDYVIVIATENGTSVSIAGPSSVGGSAGIRSTTTLNAGQVFTYNLPNIPNRAYTIATGKRAYVSHVSSYAANEFGMGILPTINPCNGSKRIDFYRTTGSSNDQAVITIPTAGLASLRFRGAAYTTYGKVVDNLTIGSVAHSIVSFPNGSIATAGTVNTVTSNERFHVGVVSNTGGASTGNFGFYSNYEAKVDVLNPITKQPDDFYTVAQVVTGVATPHCLTLTSCGTNDRITGIVNGTFTQGTSFTGACLTYTMRTNAPKCARDTIRVQVENDIGRQGIICLEFVNIDNNLISRVIPESPVICQPGGSTSLTIIAEQVDQVSGTTYKYQTITPDKQIISTSIASGTATGQYRITVTDSNNCQDTTSVFARPETATIAFGMGAVTACAGSTATYTVTSTTGLYGWTVTGATILSGGTPTSSSITVRWNSTGSIRTTVTSGNGCTAVVTRAVTVQAAPTLTATTQNPLCNGTATGSVNLSPANGTAPYTYRWSNNATTEDLTNVVAGVYSVSVADRYGCVPLTQPFTVTLTNATSLSVITNQTNPLCNGVSTGTASITARGGTPAYRYQWSTGATSQAITGLMAGSYTVTAQDANGCTLSQIISITQPPALSWVVTRTLVACNGAGTGIASLSVSGGVPGYSYRWNDGSLAQNRTGLAAGTYSVTVTDANGCTATTSALITQPTALTLSAVATSAKCNGAAQGSLDLTALGGTPSYTYRWSTGAVTEDVTNLTAGTYSVTVTDANACTRTLSATIAQPTALSLTLTPRNPTCNGVSDGGITLAVGGGTGPYTFRWSDGSNTTQNRTVLAAGPYSVTATDANGCFITANTTLTAPAALTASAVVTDVSCSSGSTGRIDLTAGGGTGVYSYSWNTGALTQDVSNLPVGEYAVTIRDANGCRFDVGATVRQPLPLSVTVLTTDAPCFGGTGDITVEVRGGTEAYTYRWNNGATTATVFGLPIGSYQLVVTDANSCTARTSATVSSPPNFAINAVVVPVSCNSGVNASINITVEGGTAPYRYRWSNGATTEDLANLPAGVYSLTVTDTNNCIEKVDINVQEPPLMSLSESHTTVSCFGGTNGAINLSVLGGTKPYSYIWNDGNGSGQAGVSTEDRATLSAGTYRVTVTDINSCSTSLSVVISQPTALSVVPSVTAVSCNGGGDGVMVLAVSGGVGPYQYQWVTGVGSATLANLFTGFYSVTITDANSCSVSLQNRVNQPTALTISSSQQDVVCNGGANGQILVTSTGGTPGYQYRWNDGSAVQNRTGLTAGMYSLTVTDANNCSQTRSFTLTQPTALVVTGTVTAVGCSGGNTGTVSLAISGGVGPYDARWNNTGTTSSNRTGLMAGIYSVTVTDANQCTVSRTFSITQPTALVASGSSRNVLCAGGSDGTISLTVSGGTSAYAFTWSGSVQNVLSQNQTDLTAGLYTVVIRDANGCQIARSFTITQPNTLQVNSRVSPVSCNRGSDGAIQLEVTGGTSAYLFRWSSGQTTQNVSGLAAGAYSVTVTDAQQCSVVVSVNVPESSLITMVARTTPTQCNGSSDGAIDLTVSGGVAPYRYQWSNAEITEDLSGIKAGDYVITVTDFNNCPASMTVVITQPAALTLTLLAQNNVCYGDLSGAINLTATGGTPGPSDRPYSYLWSHGFPDRNVGDLVVGSYSVVVTDANGCTATGSTSLISPPRLTTTFSTTDVSCFGGTNGAIELTISGGVAGSPTSPYSYTWIDGYQTVGPTTQDRTNLAANTYTATIRDQNGCQTSEVITITEPTALSLTGSVTAVSCNGNSTGAVSATALGGTEPYRYQWNTGVTTQSVSNLVAGLYSLTVTDANGCQEMLSLTITQASGLTLTGSTTAVLCNAGSTGGLNTNALGGTLPYHYRWNTGAITAQLTSLIAGVYSLTLTDANECQATLSLSVTQPTALSLTGSVTAVACNGNATGAIKAVATGGIQPYLYTWSNGATTASIESLTAGVYSLTVTDANLCTVSSSFTVSQPTALSLSSTSVNVACNGASTGSINITVSGGVLPYSYRWNDGVLTANRTSLTAGIYSLTATDANGCSISSTITLTEPTALSLISSEQNVACDGQSNGSVSLTVAGGVQSYRYVWSNGATSQNLFNLPKGNYSVVVSDANGCTLSAGMSITQPLPLTASVLGTDAVCNGQFGTITTEVRGGTPEYSYRWNTGATTATVFGLAVGSYTLVVTDANGCQSSATTGITQPQLFNLNAIVVPVACNSGANGSIDLSVDGSTAPYRYRWSTGATTQDVVGLVSGVYSVTVLDVNDCVESTTINVSEPGGLSVRLSSANLTCFENATGEVSVTAAGGTTPYRYVWADNGESAPASTSSRTGLSSGLYSVTVSDGNRCSEARSVSLSEPTALSLLGSATAVLCNGGTTGAIGTTALGGTLPYRYHWNTGATSAQLTSLTAGGYSLTLTDANTCSAKVDFTVAQPTALSLLDSLTPIACNGEKTGTIATTVLGGTSAAGYQYQWSTGETSVSVSNLSAGIYSLTVIDANSCIIARSFTLTEPTALTLSGSTVDVTRYGEATGFISVSALGGTSRPSDQLYSYQWSTGDVAASVASLTAGTYSVTVTDANRCFATLSLTVNQPTALSLTMDSQNVSCNGSSNGTASLTVSGGISPYKYQWSTANSGSGGITGTTQNLTNLPEGNYSVTVTDANGATATAAVAVMQPLPLIILAVSTSAVCNGQTGTITAEVSGGTPGYTYAWSHGATTASVFSLSVGNYSLLVTDANGCTAISSFTIGQPEPFSIVATVVPVACNSGSDGRIDLVVEGSISPYVYQWSNGATTQDISGLSSGFYSVTVVDTNGCSSVQAVTVTQPTALSIASTPINAANNGVRNGSISLTVSGGVTRTPPSDGYTYLWNDGVITADRFNLVAGTYSVTATDANACTISTTVVLSEPTASTLTLQSGNISCNGGTDGSVSLTITGGIPPYSYAWSNANGELIATTQNLTNVGVGNYKVVVTGANGDTVSAGIAVAQPLPLTVSLLFTDAVCNGQTGTITTEIRGGTPGTSEQPYQYLWNSGNTTASVYSLSVGSYTLVVTDVNGCTASTSVTITQPEPFNLSAVVIPVSCRAGNNGSINLTIEGSTRPYRIQWSTGATTEDIANLPAGIYSVTVLDANNCVESITIVVQEPPLLTVSSTSKQNPTCFEGQNGVISLAATGGVGPYSYRWADNGAASPVNTAERTGLSAGAYSATVTDANGCSVTQVSMLTQGTRPFVQLVAVPSTLSGATSRDNGQLILSGFSSIDRFDSSLGAVYSGSAILPASLPIVPANGILTQSLPNPITLQPYTVRVFDVRGCYTDVIVVLQPATFICPPEPICIPVRIQMRKLTK